MLIDRLTTESAEEREARLQRMSTHQQNRLATELAEDREARLRLMHDRLASESAEDRDARLQQLGARRLDSIARSPGLAFCSCFTHILFYALHIHVCTHSLTHACNHAKQGEWDG